jgi:hypothetical protein
MARFDRTLLCQCAVGVSGTCHPALATDFSAQEILDKVDKLYRAERSQARVRMEIKTPEYERSMDMEIFTEGLNKTFVRVLAPEKRIRGEIPKRS